MSHCIMYSDPADCSKATCEGCHMKNSNKQNACGVCPAAEDCTFDPDNMTCPTADEDPCTVCEREQGPCGLGTYVCQWPQEIDTRPCVVNAGETYDCASCQYGQVYNCFVGRC